MFNSQTIYALNRFDGSSIAYDDAYGKITLITAADFASVKEFRKWKNWDKMKKPVSKERTHQAVSDSICRARWKLIKKFKP